MPTPIPKKYFQLVNFEGQNPLDIVFGESNSSTDDWYFCDWDLDGNGQIRTIQEENAVVQTSLKNIFTEKQPNGTGTNIYELIGEKDILVRQSSLFMDITMAMVAQKLLIDSQAEKQNLSDNDLIASMGKLVVTEDPSDPSRTVVQMSLIMDSSNRVDVGVL